MTFVVIAQACRTSGALTIYRQFLSHLQELKGNNRWIIFIDPSMDHPNIPGVEYVFDSNHSWLQRINWNRKGFSEYCKDKGIVPHCIVSLQNTGVMTDIPQLIYYHQPLPFYNVTWNPFKKSERLLWAYKHLYPYFVKRTLNSDTEIVVQIPYIKKGFCEKFKFNPQKVHVLFPDISLSYNKSIKIKEDGFSHFIYPAMPHKYKAHSVIMQALKILKNQNPEIAEKVKVHFTLTESEILCVVSEKEYSYVKNMIECDGRVPFNQLMIRYDNYSGLLFPSSIETLGLPLVEAANFGLPIVANDLPYAREVLDGYEGVDFISNKDVNSWSNKILELAKMGKITYEPLLKEGSSWPIFFEIIYRIGNKYIYK